MPKASVADAGVLLLVYETEQACRDRLRAAGFDHDRTIEISSYLAQSTDIAGELDAIGEACSARGLAFVPVALDDLGHVLDRSDPARTLVWTLTDGIAYYRGGVSPALARLRGFSTIGSDDSFFALCQDKFRSGAVLRELGLPSPPAGLARNGRWIAPPPVAAGGYFVKPNRLGSKIGIWADSRCQSHEAALDLSRRIFDHYRDDAIVQAYVPGRNVRASFLAVDPSAGAEALASVFVDSGGDFQTMADSLALYGETAEAAKSAGTYAEPELATVGSIHPAAARAIEQIATQLIDGMSLRDVFSVDLRMEADGTLHLIEFEVCPGLPCFDFRDYCRRQWGMSLAEAIAATAANRLSTLTSSRRI